MRTDDLISIIAADHRQIDATWLNRAMVKTALAALAFTIVLVLATLGLRRDFTTAWMSGPVMAKLLFGASLTVIALVVFQRSLRPGLRPGPLLRLCLLPVTVVGGWAVLTLAQAPIENWPALTFGRNWRTCLVAVPLYALLPAILLLTLARHGAPIDGRLTGAAVGIASAGIAIIGYGLHCPDDTGPFVATWNTIAAAGIALLSMAIAPRVLRW